jgi:methionyl aminopeptidase
MDCTRKALNEGINQAVPGNYLSDISHVIQECVEEREYSVVRDYTGHGIGRDMHEEPQIPNFGPPGRGPVLKTGMTFVIEPMVNVGNHRVKTKDDGWTGVTEDGSLSAHFENTIAIREDGLQVLSKI